MSLYTRFELRQRARPHLEWLCRETGETCQLQIPHGDMVLVLDTVSPEVSYYLRVVPREPCLLCTPTPTARRCSPS